VWVSLIKIGDVQVAQGDLAGALESYRESRAIRERLAGADPGNAGWQRDVWVSYWRLAQFGTREERADRWRAVIAKIEEMQSRGILLPTDEPYLDAARRNLAAIEAAQ